MENAKRKGAGGIPGQCSVSGASRSCFGRVGQLREGKGKGWWRWLSV